MTKKQKELIEVLQGNDCDIPGALAKTKTTPSQFNKYLDDEDFREDYESICSLIAESKFFDLVKKGDSKAVVEFQKRKNKSGEDSKKLQDDIMEEFINRFDTKTELLTVFSKIFKVSKFKAEDLFKKIKIERGLLSPHERAQQKEEADSESLASLFMAGKLSESEMYRRLLNIHLHDAENAQYPSERKNATSMALDINRRIEEITERERQKERVSDFEISERLDALLLGTSEDHIIEAMGKVDDNVN